MYISGDIETDSAPIGEKYDLFRNLTSIFNTNLPTRRRTMPTFIILNILRIIIMF